MFETPDYLDAQEQQTLRQEAESSQISDELKAQLSQEHKLKLFLEERDNFNKSRVHENMKKIVNQYFDRILSQINMTTDVTSIKEFSSQATEKTHDFKARSPFEPISRQQFDSSALTYLNQSHNPQPIDVKQNLLEGLRELKDNMKQLWSQFDLVALKKEADKHEWFSGMWVQMQLMMWTMAKSWLLEEIADFLITEIENWTVEIDSLTAESIQSGGFDKIFDQLSNDLHGMWSKIAPLFHKKIKWYSQFKWQNNENWIIADFLSWMGNDFSMKTLRSPKLRKQYMLDLSTGKETLIPNNMSPEEFMNQPPSLLWMNGLYTNKIPELLESIDDTKRWTRAFRKNNDIWYGQEASRWFLRKKLTKWHQRVGDVDYFFSQQETNWFGNDKLIERVSIHERVLLRIDSQGRFKEMVIEDNLYGTDMEWKIDKYWTWETGGRTITSANNPFVAEKMDQIQEDLIDWNLNDSLDILSDNIVTL